jgi:5-methylcytosine-specific restriction endonuclease McrA
MPKAGKDSRADYARYRDWYLGRESSTAGKAKRNLRHEARDKAAKAGIISGPNDPREIDHKRSLTKGGSNNVSNLQALSRTANRKKYT